MSFDNLPAKVKNHAEIPSKNDFTACIHCLTVILPVWSLSGWDNLDSGVLKLFFCHIPEEYTYFV